MQALAEAHSNTWTALRTANKVRDTDTLHATTSDITLNLAIAQRKRCLHNSISDAGIISTDYTYEVRPTPSPDHPVSYIDDLALGLVPDKCNLGFTLT